MPRESGSDYLIEFITIGNSVKVSAMDPVTLTEVSIVGSPLVSQERLARLAVRKLERMILKRKK